MGAAKLSDAFRSSPVSCEPRANTDDNRRYCQDPQVTIRRREISYCICSLQPAVVGIDRWGSYFYRDTFLHAGNRQSDVDALCFRSVEGEVSFRFEIVRLNRQSVSAGGKAAKTIIA